MKNVKAWAALTMDGEEVTPRQPCRISKGPKGELIVDRKLKFKAPFTNGMTAPKIVFYSKPAPE